MTPLLHYQGKSLYETYFGMHDVLSRAFAIGDVDTESLGQYELLSDNLVPEVLLKLL